MASCCSIDIDRYFELTIIGEDFLSLSLAFHSISYGIKTALVASENLEEEISNYLERFNSYIQLDYAMPKSIQDIKEDFHLAILEGDISILSNTVIKINEKEIEGNILVINSQYKEKLKMDTDPVFKGFHQVAKIIMIAPDLWVSAYSIEDEKKEIWNLSRDFVRKILNI